MTETALSDAALLAQAREGDEAAFTELYVRHQGAARRVAASYPRAGDPDDLVNEAFERILAALRRGVGPDEAFRAYLFVTVRRLAMGHIARIRDEPVDEVPELVRAEDHAPALDLADRKLVLDAYESLPERWQAVLWQTAVEGHQPRELAGVLGMSANAAAALAYRAREKLRQAYLQAHLQTVPRPQCEPHRSRLGAYVRDGLSRRDKGATDTHLDGCRSCRSLVAELSDVNRMLVRSLFPLFATVSTASVAAAGTAAAGTLGGGGGVALLAKRVASKARTNPGVVAAVVAVAALALAMIRMLGDDEQALEVPRPPKQAAPVAVEQPPVTETPTPTPPAPEPPDEPRLAQPSRTTTTTETPTTTLPPEPVPLAPVPPEPTTTSTTAAPPPPSFVVWVPGSSVLRITIVNDTAERMDGMLTTVDLDNGAVVSGLPQGCGLSLALIWSATCSVMPLDPGETAVVRVPVAVTGPGQVARTRVCESSFLGLDCLLGRTDRSATTALT